MNTELSAVVDLALQSLSAGLRGAVERAMGRADYSGEREEEDMGEARRVYNVSIPVAGTLTVGVWATSAADAIENAAGRAARACNDEDAFCRAWVKGEVSVILEQALAVEEVTP